ncbi:hypothetical protein V1634_08130 [Plantactinospora veratri]|uniref:Uncharacterized protein n=1 Tax=Plantactinospora veratri TaxID=1436122 RepID=A0ABU7SA82_9ACTN
MPTYRVVDPLPGRMTLTEFVLGPSGEYEPAVHTDDLVGGARRGAAVHRGRIR